MEQANISALTEAVMERLFVPIEASGRHVHLTSEQAATLFSHPLTPSRPLSQPGQYLAKERLTLIGPKGEFHNVAVLGPERPEAQVELSLTDGRALGIRPPVRPSGQVRSTPGITLKGPCGTVTLSQGVMAAQRHIHLSEAEGRRFGVRDGQTVKLQAFTRRPVIFEDVLVRVHKDFCAAVHLDYDEANACGLQDGDFGRILP